MKKSTISSITASKLRNAGMCICLLLLSACNKYDNSYQELSARLQAINRKQPLLIYAYTRADCLSCHTLINETFTRMRHIPEENKMIVMPHIRAKELSLYEHKFRNVAPASEMIADDALFETLRGKIADDHYQAGGFIVLDTNDKVLCSFSLKDPLAQQILDTYLHETAVRSY